MASIHGVDKAILPKEFYDNKIAPVFLVLSFDKNKRSVADLCFTRLFPRSGLSTLPENVGLCVVSAHKCVVAA